MTTISSNPKQAMKSEKRRPLLRHKPAAEDLQLKKALELLKDNARSTRCLKAEPQIDADGYGVNPFPSVFICGRYRIISLPYRVVVVGFD